MQVVQYQAPPRFAASSSDGSPLLRPGNLRSMAYLALAYAFMVNTSALGDSCSLILFPEGTRGSGDEVAAFKSGIYYLCQQRSDLRLVPAYLNNLNRILPKGEFLPVPFISRLTFGPPLRLDRDESKPEFLARARQAVCRLKDL